MSRDAILRAAPLRDYFMPTASANMNGSGLIAKDDDSQYWECLDCGRSSSGGPPSSPSLPPAESSVETKMPPGSAESLSDA